MRDFLDNYIQKLFSEDAESDRREILLDILINQGLEAWLQFCKDIINAIRCEKRECGLLLQDLVESLKEYFFKERRHFYESKTQIEHVLYIYYFFTRLYELLWRVRNLEELIEEIPKQITLIPFIKDFACLKEFKFLKKSMTYESALEAWLEKYLSLASKAEGVLFLEQEDVADYLRDIFEDGKFKVLIYTILTSKGPLYFAFKITERNYSEWERLLLLEDLPSILHLIVRLVLEKEEESVFFDSITGLPRQTYFLFKLEKMIEKASRTGESLLVGIVDVDRFTAINQVFGYDVGDEVLIELAKRLKEQIVDGEIARGRGSSFIFALNTSTPYEILRRIKEELSKPVKTSKNYVEFTLSLGGSTFPEDGDDPRVLLRCAESSLKEAKKEGGNNIYLFKREFYSRAKEYLYLLPKLKKALKESQFILYTQPRISLKEQRVIGGEILVRWVDPEEGIIPPGRFIWIMEDSGLIKELGYWIVEESCKIMQSLKEGLYVALDLSLNLSPQQLKEVDLVRNLQNIFEKYSVCPTKLTIEITENIFVDDPETIAEQIKRLTDLGVKVALDDFGTGYSSFKYLSTLPFHDLKIDLIFVQNMLNSYTDLEIVKTIVSLAKILNKKVIAEGVETQEQLKHLILLGVDEAQGYYFAPPMPWTKFLHYIETFAPEKYFHFLGG
ncbi:MAG: EAL domain-containing protein [Caldimicrobium sp.]|nr:EAL domain-containing protein [Caldimicrobium sp.]